MPCRLAGLAVLVVLAAGCAATVAVEQSFPLPLVEPLPLRMAIHYPESLAEYVYREDEAERDWTVQLGAANVRMFDSVFTSLFRESRRVTNLEAAAQELEQLDGIVSPVVDAFEFSLPGQTADGRVGVWIRYNVDVHAADGQLIIRWPVTAYGQSGVDGLGEEQSMERAIVLAMRDAAATIAVEFPRQPQVRERLLHETPVTAP